MRLALDTAYSACSVALSGLDGNLITSKHLEQRRGQAETLVPMVGEVLQEAGVSPSEIKEIVVNIGPGTFAGVRIATSFARALALSSGAKIIGITAFEALAGTVLLKKQVKNGETILALVPGKRGEVSAELFSGKKGALASKSEPKTMPLGDLPGFTGDQKVLVTGPDLENYLGEAKGLNPHETASFWPTAVDLLDLAANLGPGRAQEKVSPFYLRPADAKPQEKSRFSSENG